MARTGLTISATKKGPGRIHRNGAKNAFKTTRMLDRAVAQRREVIRPTNVCGDSHTIKVAV